MSARGGRAGSARWSAEGAAEERRVRVGEGGVGGERLLAALLACQHRAQLAPAGDAEVERGPDPLARERMQWPAESPTKNTPSSAAGRSSCGNQLPW